MNEYGAAAVTRQALMGNRNGRAYIESSPATLLPVARTLARSSRAERVSRGRFLLDIAKTARAYSPMGYPGGL
jgi:hypothetical protein